MSKSRLFLSHDFSSSIWFLLLQWGYAFWQAVRNTKGFNLCYYGLQWFFISTRCGTAKKKRIIWVNKDYNYQASEHGESYFGPYQTWEEFSDHMLGTEHNGIHYLSFKDYWYQIEYKHKYYWVHQEAFFESYKVNPSDCVFVKDLYNLGRNYWVAQQISEEEAMLMLFKRDHFYPLESGTVIYGREFNIEYNSKISGFLATIPLILQARKLSGASGIASLILLLIDFFRTPIYRGYDKALFYLTKFMKLYVFRKRTLLYSFFGLFSNRWRCCDVRKGYAYMIEGEVLEVTSYISMLGRDDCTLQGLRIYDIIATDIPHFIIRNGVVTSGDYWHYMGVSYVALFKINKKVFVS